MAPHQVDEPGNALLRARAAKAAAVPLEERSRDVDDFVQRSAMWDAALERLVPLMAAPATADPAQVAQGLALALKAVPLFGMGTTHYQGYTRAYSVACSPLMELDDDNEGMSVRLELGLGALLRLRTSSSSSAARRQRRKQRRGQGQGAQGGGGGAAGAAAGGASESQAALLLVLRATMAAWSCCQAPACKGSAVAMRWVLALCLELERHLGPGSGLAAGYAAQLAALQGGQPEAWRLTVQELLVLCLKQHATAANHLRTKLLLLLHRPRLLLWLRLEGCTHQLAADVARLGISTSEPLAPLLGPSYADLPAASLAALLRLQRMQPRHPRWPFLAALAGSLIQGHGAAEVTANIKQGLEFLQTAMRLADEEDRPYWLALAAFDAVEQRCLSAAAGVLRAAVADIQPLMRQGEDALKRVKGLLPQMSILQLQRARDGEARSALRVASDATPNGGRIPHSLQVRPSAMQRALLLLAAALALQWPRAASARKLQVTTDDRDSQSFPWNLPDALSRSDDLPLDQAPLARTVSGFQPEGVHLTQWTQDSVLVSWQTGEPLLGSAASPAPQPHDPSAVPSVVRWGTKRGELERRAEGGPGVVYTYAYGEGNGNATYHSPILHHVVLKGLRPGTTYFYSVGCEAHGWSGVFSFTTLRPTFPLRLGIVGDLGQTANSSATLAKLTASKPDVVVIAGDFTYADDHPPGNASVEPFWGNIFVTEQRRWDSWARLTQPLLARLPLVSCRGNHEIEQLLEARNATMTAANARYPYPQDPARIATQPNIGAWFLDQQGASPAAGVQGQARFKNESSFESLGYYSVDLAPGVHIVSLNSYLPWGRESRQYRWLQDDLAAVDRQRTPWLVVLFHAAGYHSYAGHYKEADTFMALLEPLFYRYQVDLVYSGHVHAYERTFPVYQYKRDECGPVYTLIGDGGNVEGLYKEFIDAQPQPAFCADPTLYQLPVYQPISGKDPVITLQDGHFCPNRQPDWSAYREPTFGHGVLEIQNATHATWVWHRTLDSGAEGGVDRVTISKSPEGACAAAALRAAADVAEGGARRGLDAAALRGRPSLLASLQSVVSAVYTWL